MKANYQNTSSKCGVVLDYKNGIPSEDKGNQRKVTYKRN